jgi:acyl carrier protein
MREIWIELLGTENVGIQDSFFKLGGHSLLAIRLISRIEGALNVRIPIQILFDRPTIKTLTEYVVERMIEADKETNSD